jgi:CubicO group peptidase (beta-lactamase class C family)
LADCWLPLQQVLSEGLDQGVYTGAVALVGLRGELLWEAAVGRVSREPQTPAVTPATFFDLASLTKPLATALALMLLVQQGRLRLESTLGEALGEPWLPPDKYPLTLAGLLAHRAGLPAWRPFYEDVLAAPLPQRAGLLERLAAAAPLEHAPCQRESSDDPLMQGTLTNPPGGLIPPVSKGGLGGISLPSAHNSGRGTAGRAHQASAEISPPTVYSDLGFMLLKAVVEKIAGQALDRFCREAIYRPLGLKTLGFCPRRQPGADAFSFAATEPGLIPGRHLFGEVHDENAWAAGGVAGHAGLFGTGGEVFSLLAALYRAYRGEAGPGQPFSPVAVRRVFTPVAPGARALGFDVPGPEVSQCSAGRYFSARSVGHLGFTGTSFWLDLELGQMVVLLTNRVHLGRDDKSKIQAFRPRFHEAASRTLGFARTYR